MEMKPFKFNIELKRDETRKQFFVLVMNEEIEELMGDPVCCQRCKTPILSKFYICEQYFKWFCEDCQLKQGKTKKILCKFDDKHFGKHGDEHIHYCIKQIIKE